MSKKVVREVPFSDNVVKVIYDDGSFGLRSTKEGSDVPETQIDDIAATGPEMEQAKQESNPMLKKYVEQMLRKESGAAVFPEEVEALPQKDLALKEWFKKKKGY